MNAVTIPVAGRSGIDYLKAWWPVLIGLAVMYLPTWWDLANSLWGTDEQGHGPIVLLVAVYLIWQRRDILLGVAGKAQGTTGHFQPRPILGWSIVAIGLLAYAVGRSQTIWFLEVGSQIPVLGGILLVALGSRALGALWFPVLFLLFMVPLPSFVVDTLTGPLKQFASLAAEHILHAAGYPIGRSGVVLTVGQYQLLVADACSGLHSIFSLTALGLLYLHQIRHPGWLRNTLLMASIVPIAVAANVMRVIVLILITYHFGDAAGQGFAHSFASVSLFLVALMLLLGLDGLLGLFIKRPREAGQSA